MVTLNADIIFVNQIPFIITYGKGVRMIAVEWISNRTGKQLANKLTKVSQLYLRGGFIVQTIPMDMGSEKVKELMQMTNIKISDANKHVAGSVCDNVLDAFPQNTGRFPQMKPM